MNLQQQLDIQRMYDEAINNAKPDATTKPDAPRRGRPPKLQPPAERPVSAAFAAPETEESES